ncbi:MAG: hypothetical protein IBX41_03885 [Methanophagales archaeon]|nr:hypothetical protein [Methanophagales archaeon]
MTSVEICKCFPYINETADNLQKISEEEVLNLLEKLREADCLVLVAEGRSKAALYIGLGQITKDVKLIEDIDFPGRNLLEAAPVLKTQYEKIALVINSSGGETTTPKEIAKDLVGFISKRDSNTQFSIHVVTSKPYSSIGRLGKKNGTMLKLSGPKSKAKTTDVFKQGIMNDVYELGSMVLFQKLKEAINEGRDHQWVINEITREMAIVGKIVDQYVYSTIYQRLVENLSTRGHATVGGRGPAKNVAEMTVIRLQHVKRAMGDQAYLSGELAPKPRLGDTLLLVSWSGENKPLLAWQKEYETAGANIFSIVGNQSSLSESTGSIVIKSPASQFYLHAAFLLSPLPLLLVKNLKGHGFGLPPEIMGWYHTISE